MQTPNDPPAPTPSGGDTIADAIAKASDEISRICVGRGGTTKSGLAGRQWTMCIPVRDDDSDEIFSRLVVVCQQLQAENASLTAALLAARALRFAVANMLDIERMRMFERDPEADEPSDCPCNGCERLRAALAATPEEK